MLQLGLRVYGLGFRVQGLGSRVLSLGAVRFVATWKAPAVADPPLEGGWCKNPKPRATFQLYASCPKLPTSILRPKP